MTNQEQIEAKAKELYNNSTNNDDTIHCNRFPSWEELSEPVKANWRTRANRRNEFDNDDGA